MYTTHFVTNANLQTAYYDIGKGEPLLLVHGFTGSKLDFLSQLAWFSEHSRLIAYDQRGHGESTNRGPYSLPQLATDLVSLLDTLEIPTCHILGHSLGGMVVLRAILAHPDRFKSLLLMDTAPGAMDLFDEKTRDRLNNMVTKDGCQALVASMQGQPQPSSVQRGIDFLGEHEHWRRIRVKLEQMDPKAFTDLGEELANQAEVTAALNQISVPTTVIVGADDTPFLNPSRVMTERIMDAELVVIDHAAHSPHYENPEDWRAAVDAHLTRARSL